MLRNQRLKPHSVLLWIGFVLLAITRSGLSTAIDESVPVDGYGNVVPHTFIVCYQYFPPWDQVINIQQCHSKPWETMSAFPSPFRWRCLAVHDRGPEKAPAARHTYFKRTIAGFVKTTLMVTIATNQSSRMRTACTNSRSITVLRTRAKERHRTWTPQVFTQNTSLCHIGTFYTPLPGIVLPAHHVSSLFFFFSFKCVHMLGPQPNYS